MCRAAAVVCLLLSLEFTAQQTQQSAVSLYMPVARVTSDAPVLQLPSDVSPADCQISTYLTGAFGGHGGFGQRVNAREYELAVMVGSQRARALKAIVHCRGKAFELVDIPTGPDERVNIPLRLRALATIPLRGTVLFPADRTPGPVALRLTYMLDWAHTLFGISDGMVPMVDLGTKRLNADGTFAFEVPDFANDPAVARFQHRGGLWLQVIDPETLNLLYSLSSDAGTGFGNGSGRSLLPLAWSYPHLRLSATPSRQQ